MTRAHIPSDEYKQQLAAKIFALLPRNPIAANDVLAYVAQMQAKAQREAIERHRATQDRLRVARTLRLKAARAERKRERAQLAQR